MQRESSCQSPNLETQDILILLSLKPRPLHLEGLEPNLFLCPTTTTTSQDMQLVFFKATPTLLLRTHVFQGAPRALPGGRLSPLGRGEPPGGQAQQKYSASFLNLMSASSECLTLVSLGHLGAQKAGKAGVPTGVLVDIPGKRCAWSTTSLPKGHGFSSVSGNPKL